LATKTNDQARKANPQQQHQVTPASQTATRRAAVLSAIRHSAKLVKSGGVTLSSPHARRSGPHWSPSGGGGGESVFNRNDTTTSISTEVIVLEDVDDDKLATSALALINEPPDRSTDVSAAAVQTAVVNLDDEQDPLLGLHSFDAILSQLLTALKGTRRTDTETLRHAFLRLHPYKVFGSDLQQSVHVAARLCKFMHACVDDTLETSLSEREMRKTVSQANGFLADAVLFAMQHEAIIDGLFATTANAFQAAQKRFVTRRTLRWKLVLDEHLDNALLVEKLTALFNDSVGGCNLEVFADAGASRFLNTNDRWEAGDESSLLYRTSASTLRHPETSRRLSAHIRLERRTAPVRTSESTLRCLRRRES
jgi:hypothetical protein